MKPLIVLLSLLAVVACGSRQAATGHQDAESPESAFERQLSGSFVGSESGIVSFRIDQSLIYVEVDDSVPPEEYQPMARAWALTFSQERQKRGGGNVTAYIVRGGRTYATVNYGPSKGFH